MYYRNYRDRNLNGANFTQMAKFLDQWILIISQI